MKEFDLNIGKILEDWEIYHAIREIVANALDEHLLTNTAEIEILLRADMRFFGLVGNNGRIFFIRERKPRN